MIVRLKPGFSTIANAAFELVPGKEVDIPERYFDPISMESVSQPRVQHAEAVISVPVKNTPVIKTAVVKSKSKTRMRK